MLSRALWVAVAIMAFSPASFAAVAEGKDYTVLREAQPSEAKGKVEVVEVFSYACPHCFEMHPRIEAWAAIGLTLHGLAHHILRSRA